MSSFIFAISVEAVITFFLSFLSVGISCAFKFTTFAYGIYWIDHLLARKMKIAKTTTIAIKKEKNVVAKTNVSVRLYCYWHRYCKIIENRLNHKNVIVVGFFALVHKFQIMRIEKLVQCKPTYRIQQRKNAYARAHISAEIDAETWICCHFPFRGYHLYTPPYGVCMCMCIYCTFAFYKRNKSSK